MNTTRFAATAVPLDTGDVRTFHDCQTGRLTQGVVIEHVNPETGYGISSGMRRCYPREHRGAPELVEYHPDAYCQPPEPPETGTPAPADDWHGIDYIDPAGGWWNLRRGIWKRWGCTHGFAAVHCTIAGSGRCGCGASWDTDKYGYRRPT